MKAYKFRMIQWFILPVDDDNVVEEIIFTALNKAKEDGIIIDYDYSGVYHEGEVEVDDDNDRSH